MPPSDERGSSTVHVLAVVMLLVGLAVGVAGFAGLATAKHRATTAADLAAIAAASSSAMSPVHACDVAVLTARRNGGRLVDCVVQGSEVMVAVEVAAAAPFGLRPRVRARALAGPSRVTTQ